MTKKITISLDDDLAEEAQRRLVDGGRAPSFSAAVADALTTRLDAARRASARMRAELARAEQDDPAGFAAARTRADAVRAELAALNNPTPPRRTHSPIPPPPPGYPRHPKDDAS